MPVIQTYTLPTQGLINKVRLIRFAHPICQSLYSFPFIIISVIRFRFMPNLFGHLLNETPLPPAFKHRQFNRKPIQLYILQINHLIQYGINLFEFCKILFSLLTYDQIKFNILPDMLISIYLCFATRTLLVYLPASGLNHHRSGLILTSTVVAIVWLNGGCYLAE